MESMVDETGGSVETDQSQVTTSQAATMVVTAIPNQPVQVQSVIQPSNQPSVIQTAPLQTVQVHITTVPESEGNNGMENEMECRKRHDILSRRPSYRKILNDLSSGAPGVAKIEEENENETVNSITSLANSQGHSMQNYHTVNAGQQSTQTLQLVSEGLQQQGGLHTITMSNAGAQGAVVQLAQSQDGQQYFVPVNASDLQSYPIKLSGALPQGVVVAQQGNVPTQQQLAEEATRKRELRLMKNRIAAKECRGKKKEYVKCLENRVAVLENQNKALIEELKALKDLYCHKSE